MPSSAKKWSSSIVSLHVMKPNGEVTSWSNNQNEILTPEVALSHNQVVSNAGSFNQIPASGPSMQSMPLQNRPVFNTAQPSIPSQTGCKHDISTGQWEGTLCFPPFFYYLHLQKTQFLFMYSYEVFYIIRTIE